MIIGPDDVQQRLSGRPTVRSPGRGRPSAVLIPMLERAGETYLVLTRRAETLREHKGQYAFPGGGRDPGDATAETTALREAHEEIGLDPSEVRVLGMLDDLVTITDFVITPVVGWIRSGVTYQPSAAEVALVVELPLAAFLTPPRALTLQGDGSRRLVLAFEVDGHFIWGATANILRNLVATLQLASDT